MNTLRSLPALARRRPVIAGLLVLIVILGAVLRADKIGTSTRVSVDERSYLGIANNMVVHRSYAYGSNPLHWAPGTPFMFTAVMKLTGTGAIDNHKVGASNPPLYAQATVGTLAILAVFAFAAWLGGAIPGLVAAFFTAIYDPLVLVSRSYLSEPLGGLFFVIAVFAICAAVANPERRKRFTLFAGFLLGCAVLARNDLLLLFGVLPGLSFLIAWKREGLRPAFRLAALMVVGAVVTVTPWVTYASLQQHKLTPITTAGPSSLWVATYLPAQGRQILLKRQFAPEVCKTFPTAEDACNVTATNLDMRLIFKLLAMRHPGKTQDEAISLELNKNLKEDFSHPGKFASMLGNKFGRIWFEPWGGGAVGKQESSVWQHRLLIGISALGILAGLIFGGRRRKYVLLGAASLLTVTALNTVFVSESRMSMRMDPLLFAIGIGAIGAAFRARNGDDEPALLASDDAAIAPTGTERNAADRAGTTAPAADPAGAPETAGAQDTTGSQQNPIQPEPAKTDTGAVTSATDRPLLQDSQPRSEGST